MITAARSNLSKTLLVACDQAYNPAVSPGSTLLAPHPDSTGPGADVSPNTMPPEWNSLGLNQWAVVIRRDDPSTGFGATVYRKANADGSGDYIVAMQGTRGLNIQDWGGNLIYGWDKWGGPSAGLAQALLSEIVGLADVNKIHFTGQSLGGALAQYALYDYAAQKPDFDASKVTLTTFSGLGGMEALSQNRSGFTPSLVANVDTAHFYITNDIVSRLGEGHLNGSVNGNVNEYVLGFAKIGEISGLPQRRQDMTPVSLDLVSAHRIESGFYAGFNRASGVGDPNWPSDFAGARPKPISNLHIAGLARAGAYIAWLTNQDGALATEAEALARTAAALTYGLAFGNQTEIKTLSDALLDSLHAADVVSSRSVLTLLKATAPTFLSALAASPSGIATHFAGQFLALAVESSGPSTQVEAPAGFAERYVELVIGARLAGATPTIDPSLIATDAMARLTAAAGTAKSVALYIGAANLLAVAALFAVPSIAISARNAAAAAILDLSATLANDASAYSRGVLREVAKALRENLSDGVDAFSKTMSDVGRALVSAAIDVSRSATVLAIDGKAFVESTRTSVADGLGDIARSISNAYSDLTLKFTDTFEWGETVTRSSIDSVVKGLSEAAQDVATGGRATFEKALDVLKRSGQTMLIDSGTGINPFNADGFDPDALDVPSAEATEGRAKLITLSLPYEAGAGGQKVKLTFAGTSADKIRLFVGEEVLAQNGVFTVTVPEGARQLALTLIEDGDIDADLMIEVRAQLVDAAGNPTHLEHTEAMLAVTAREEQAAEVTLSGADGIDVFIQSDDGYTGKRASLSGGGARDLIGGSSLEDAIDGGDGDDLLLGAGGPDAILGGAGNDFIALSVSGAANIDAGAGDDIVDARRFVDFQVREADLSALTGFGTGTYAAVMKDVLANLRITAQGDVRGGRVGNAPGGLPYLISFSPSTFSGLSQGIGLDASGQLVLKAGGSASFSLATRTDGQGWNVTYTAAGSTRTFVIVAGEFAGPQNAGGVSIDGGAGRDRLIGSLGADLIRGGDDDDGIAGHDGDDVLMGEAGLDTIFGGEGEDFVDGGAGNDTLIGEGGDDALVGADGDDWIEGDSSDTPVALHGNDLLRGDAGNDVLLGWGGDDELVAGAGADQLSGGDGNDALYGGTENDTLAGGAGDDLLDGGSGNDTIAGDSGNDTARGGDGADIIAGGAGDDLLEGGAGIDQLQGGAGNDLIFGGADNDIVFGEAGDDQIAGEAGSDFIDAGTGNDLLYGGAGADTYFYKRGDGGDRIFDTPGEGNVIRFAQEIDGTPISFELGSLIIRVAGIAGDEIHLDGFDPGDPLGSSPIDFLEFWNGSSFNRVSLSSFLDQQGLKISGTEAADQLQGTILRDLLFGTGGDDYIDALDGNDVIDGGSGADVMIGGPGDDTYKVDDAGDQVIEFTGEGSDTVEATFSYSLEGTVAENLMLQGSALAGTGNELSNSIRGNSAANVLFGNAGNDFLRGEDGNDALDGGSGNDGLIGGRGDDRLIGGAGSDGLQGGLGNDTYVFGPGDGTDGIAEVDVAFDGFFGSGTDTLELQASPSEVVITRTLFEARVELPATGDVLTVPLQYSRVQQGQYVSRVEGIRFGEGADELFDDYITPVAPTVFADTLFGGNRSDTLLGLNGADVLYGMGGDDVLEGGPGSDVLSGGDGDDVYVWGHGSGHDRVDDFDQSKFHVDSPFDVPRFFYTGFNHGFEHSANEVDTVQIDADLSPADIHVSRSGSAYVLAIRHGCDTLTLDSWGSDVALRPEFHKETRGLRVVFADGTVWDRTQLDDLITPTPPTEGVDTIQGTPRDDVLLGLGGNDSLFGFAGNDTLDGGAGNDSLDGGSGSDTYLFGRGGGSDTITAGDSGVGAIDRLLFAPDVAPADVVVRKEFQSLVLSISDSGDSIKLQSHFSLAADARLDLVEFADGTMWDKQTLLLRSVTGTEGADTIESFGAGAVLDGGGGNDTLFGSSATETLLGGAGDDVIRDSGGIDLIDGGSGDDVLEAGDGVAGDMVRFGFGAGHDVVNGANQDIIVLDADVTPTDVRVVEGERDLRLELPATGDSLTVNGWRNILFFGNPSLSYTSALKEVRFADGTVWNQSALTSRAVSGMVGTASSDTLYGTLNADTLEGFAGNDTLNGFDGIDIYRFDRGYGVDTVVDSFDFLRNAGNLIRLGGGLVPSATFVVREGNNTAFEFGGGDKLIVKDEIFFSSFSRITSLEFADGTVWNSPTIFGMSSTAVAGGTPAANMLSGTNGAEYIDAREGDDTIFANGGNDVLIGGAGNDSLFGGAGSDLYFFAAGFGFDTLSDPGGADEIDAIRFAPEIVPADIAVTRDPSGSLYLVHLGGTDKIVFPEGDIERVEFAEGTAWDAAQLQAMAELLPATALDDLLFGTPGGDLIDGLGGNDLIRGSAGDDILDGGPGTDTLVGDEGNDTFVLARGNGEDIVSQLDTTELFIDTLSVQALPSEVRATRDETHLYVSISGGDARAKLDGWFAATATDANRIDQVRFGDGTTWDRSQLLANLTHTEPTAGDDRIFGVDDAETISALAGNDTVLGRGGDDTLDGGPGDDVLEGGDGANVYLYDRGGGTDRVIALNDGALDTLRLGPGLTPADVRLIVLPASNDLTLAVPGSADRVTIQGGYADAVAGRQTLQIAFDGGVLWSADSLASRADIMEPPVLLAPLPDQSVLQDQFFEYRIPSGTFSDPDGGDTLALSANLLLGFLAFPLPGWLSLDAGSGTLRGTPTKNDVTTYNIRVTATDSTNQIASDVFALSVVNVNDAPELAVPLQDATATAGTSFSYTFQSLAFRDPDPGSLTYSAAIADGSVLPSWLTFSPQLRRFNGSPTVEDVGQFEVRVSAADPFGESASDVFLLNISAPPPTLSADGNHSPVLVKQIPDQMVPVGAHFEFTIPEGTFVDEDVEHENGEFCGDALAYQATLADGSLLPGWLQFDPATRRFSGTPAAGDAGDLSVRVLAYDTNGASARETFLVKVQSATTNRPPLAAPIENQEAVEDAAFVFVVPPGTFTDPDAGDVLTLSADLVDGSPLPAWLQFHAAGSFSGTPANGDVGRISIRLTAIDTALQSAGGEFSLSVVNVNDAPIIASPFADQTVLIDSTFSFTVPGGTFTDVDVGDVLSLSASLADGSPLPAWISFDAVTGTFSGSAGDDEEGNYSIRLVATDQAGASVADEFRLGVICTEGVTRTGTSGADTLRGTHCDDVLDGGAGIDTLIGKGGNDLYFVDATLVRDPQGNEGVGNGEDPAPPGHGDNQNDGPGTGPGDPGSAGGNVGGSTGGSAWSLVPDTVVEAADGGYDTVVAAASFALPDNVEELHLAGPLALDGMGNALDNVIVGNDAANRIAGGAGDDLLMGGGGGDTYLVRPNEGADLIGETAADGGGQDWLEFGAGIASAAVGVARSGEDLVFVLPRSGNSVTVAAWFASDNARVEHVRFADGTVWNELQIERMFEGPAAGSSSPSAGGDASITGAPQTDASLETATTDGGVPASASRVGAPTAEQADDPVRRGIQSLIDRWFDEMEHGQPLRLSHFAEVLNGEILDAHSNGAAANAVRWKALGRLLSAHLAEYADVEGDFGTALPLTLGLSPTGSNYVVDAIGLDGVSGLNLKPLQGLKEGLARLS